VNGIWVKGGTLEEHYYWWNQMDGELSSPRSLLQQLRYFPSIYSLSPFPADSALLPRLLLNSLKDYKAQDLTDDLTGEDQLIK
jgi:hypothetical protein